MYTHLLYVVYIGSMYCMYEIYMYVRNLYVCTVCMVYTHMTVSKVTFSIKLVVCK